jgi:hypothetical protein
MCTRQAGATDFSKTSRRDIAAMLARKGNGATTVSGTCVLAARAGIDVFVTGGIGQLNIIDYRNCGIIRRQAAWCFSCVSVRVR